MHTIEERTYSSTTKKEEIEKEIKQYAEKRGDGLYGGIIWKNLSFSNYDEAEEYIRNFCVNKDYVNIAVTFWEHKGNITSKKCEEIKKRIAETKQKASEYAETHSVNNFKSKFVSCPKCQSKINKDYIRFNKCSVCNTNLQSETTKKALESYQTKLENLKRLLFEENKMLEEKNTNKSLCWVIRFEYHS